MQMNIYRLKGLINILVPTNQTNLDKQNIEYINYKWIKNIIKFNLLER